MCLNDVNMYFVVYYTGTLGAASIRSGVFAGRRVICVGTPNTRIGAGKLEDRVDYSDSLSSGYLIFDWFWTGFENV